MLRLVCFIAALIATPAFGQAAPPPDARAAYAERRALLEADASCRLFTPQMRSALESAALQARGALARNAWTTARLAELESAAVAAARERRCDDPRTLAAAQRARTAFSNWSHLLTMTFRGGARTWIARRNPTTEAWKLAQEIPAPAPATFGVRVEGAPRRDVVAFALPLSGAQSPPASAQLLVRDPARADAAFLDAPGRLARGLEAGAPANQVALRFWASDRSIETRDRVRRVVFHFPNDALVAVARLDPRESVVIVLGDAANAQRYLVEVGDMRAAIAFLNAGE